MIKLYNPLRATNKYDYLVFILLVIFSGIYYKFFSHNWEDGKQVYLNIVTEIVGIYISVRWINGAIEKNNKKDRFRNYFVRELQSIYSYLRPLNPSQNLILFAEIQRKTNELNTKFSLNKKFFSEDEISQILEIFFSLKGLMKIQETRVGLASKMEQIKFKWNKMISEVNETRTQKISLLKNKLIDLKSGGCTAEEYKGLLEDIKYYLTKQEITNTLNYFIEQLGMTQQRDTNYASLRFPANIESSQFWSNPVISAKIKSYVDQFQTDQNYEDIGDFQIALEQEIPDIDNTPHMLSPIKELKKEAVRNLQTSIPIRQDFLARLGEFTNLLNSFTDNIFEETEKVI